LQTTLSHYRILEQIGAGGMGVVYRAHDERLDRDVALKVLTPGTLANEATRRRFHKEALMLSKLSHPNIATVFDFDTQDGIDFLVTEFIPGLTLDSMVANGPLAEKEIVRLGSQLAEGLEAAHQLGIIHRDLKPENVRVTHDARLKILDFGLARHVHGDAGLAPDTKTLSEDGSVSGTLPYMAPEQLLGNEPDPRTDIWGAGCVLYEMATGRRPFLGSGPALTDSILHQAPAPPSKLNPLLPWALEAIILKCLEKDLENRYQSAHELVVDFRRLASSSAIHPVSQPARRRRPTLVLAVMLPVLLALAVIAAWRIGRGSKSSQSAAPSIAVLPFVDMSPEKDQEYFSDGLAEELLNDLAKIPGLRVAARTSSFQFKGKTDDVRTVGEKLNVGSILEGSVRKQGGRVRITAQLIKVEDGFHQWSETYDRELNDVLAVQDEIARKVAGSLKVALLERKTATSSARGTNAEAYNSYLQGQYFLVRRSKENLEKAIGYYEQAIKLDSGYASAWVGLAVARSVQADASYLPVEEGYGKSREAAERALTLDADLAEAHAAMGRIKRIYDWDWAGADAAYQRAVALEPGNATVVRGAASLAATLGRFEEALAQDRRAVEMDPLSVATHYTLGNHAYRAGRLEEAVAALKKALELDPERPVAHTSLGRVYLAQAHAQEALAEMDRETDPAWHLFGRALAYHALGRNKESDAALAELIAKYQAVKAFQIADVYAFRGEVDRAFEWLERAYAERDGGLSEMKGDPLLKNLERDPRYVAFLKMMGLN